jgi:hypothetical protein
MDDFMREGTNKFATSPKFRDSLQNNLSSLSSIEKDDFSMRYNYFLNCCTISVRILIAISIYEVVDQYLRPREGTTTLGRVFFPMLFIAGLVLARHCV